MRLGTTGCPVRSYSLMPLYQFLMSTLAMILNASLYLSPVPIQFQQSRKLYSADSAPASLGNSASLSDWAFSKASLKRLASRWSRFSKAKVSRVGRICYVLSLFANRIASVCGSGSPSLTSAAAFHTQLRSLPTLGESFMSGTTA